LNFSVFSSKATRHCRRRWKKTRSIAKSWVADLHGVLGADEAEVAPEFGQEAPEVLQQCAMKVGLRVAGGETEELEVVGVLELGQSRWRQLSRQC